MSSYVYLRSEPTLWTVGFYRPDGKWEAESDHGSPDEAAQRVAYLNGDVLAEMERLKSQLAQADQVIASMRAAIDEADAEPGRACPNCAPGYDCQRGFYTPA